MAKQMVTTVTIFDKYLGSPSQNFLCSSLSFVLTRFSLSRSEVFEFSHRAAMMICILWKMMIATIEAIGTLIIITNV